MILLLFTLLFSSIIISKTLPGVLNMQVLMINVPMLGRNRDIYRLNGMPTKASA